MDVADATGHLTERDQEITVVNEAACTRMRHLLAAQGLQRTLERPKCSKAESINLATRFGVSTSASICISSGASDSGRLTIRRRLRL